MKFANAELPVLSVCIITYNHERYIEQAMDSVLSQLTDFPCEIIVADDCSSDRTREILEKYSEKYPIRLLFQKTNRGPGLNWLDLVNSAKGQYVAYLEGDDYWTDDHKLQIQVDFLERNPDISFCFHRLMEFNNETKAEHVLIPFNDAFKRIQLTQYLMADNFIPLLTVVYRNRLVEIPSWFSQNNFLGDLAFCALNGTKGDIGYIPKTMASYRISNTGIWSLQPAIHKINKLLNTYQLIYDSLTVTSAKNAIRKGMAIEKFKLSYYQLKLDKKNWNAFFNLFIESKGLFYWIQRKWQTHFLLNQLDSKNELNVIKL